MVGRAAMGMTNGAWCVGCCWALMASLFALGVMSAVWMAVVAVLIALEKTLPWRRTATYGTAVVLLILGVLVLAAPQALPGLTVPAPDPMSMTSSGDSPSRHEFGAPGGQGDPVNAATLGTSAQARTASLRRLIRPM